MIKENIYLTKKSNQKFEVVTKDILLDEGVYIFFELNPGLYVLQKKIQQDQHNSSFPSTILPEREKGWKKQEIEKIDKVEEEKSQSYKPKETIQNKEENNQVKEKSNYTAYTDGQEWYKAGLELKAKLGDSFLAIEDPEEIRKISYVLKNEINSGDVLGIRGFDRTYYIFKRQCYEKNKSILLAALKEGNKTLEELRTKLDVKEQLLKGLIEITKEQGEIIEPKKGIFKIVKG